MIMQLLLLLSQIDSIELHSDLYFENCDLKILNFDQFLLLNENFDIKTQILTQKKQTL